MEMANNKVAGSKLKPLFAPMLKFQICCLSRVSLCPSARRDVTQLNFGLRCLDLKSTDYSRFHGASMTPRISAAHLGRALRVRRGSCAYAVDLPHRHKAKQRVDQLWFGEGFGNLQVAACRPAAFYLGLVSVGGQGNDGPAGAARSSKRRSWRVTLRPSMPGICTSMKISA